jgi:hypothetical protein
MSKKRITLKINPGEAALVASIDTLTHMAETYALMASSCKDKAEAASWILVSEQILEWVSKTRHSGQVDDNEEQW